MAALKARLIMAISTEMGKYLDFPCEFGFRVLGSNRPELEDSVTSVIVNDFAMEILRPIEKHTSRNGSYVSLKVTVRLESDEQLRSLYEALGKAPHVRGVL